MNDCYKLTIADRSINWNLLHMQIHVPHHAAMHALSNKMSNNRADAWI